MSSVLDAIIQPAYRLIRVIGDAGRGTNPERKSEGLEVLNQYIDHLLTQRLVVYSINRSLQTLAAGKQTYQAGSGAPDWNIPWPKRVERASLLYGSDSAQVVEIPIESIDTDAWQEIPVKSIQGPIPTVVYADGSFPYNNISFYPIPSVSNQVALYLWNQLSQYAAITDVVSLPAGYLRLLRTHLALELAPYYEKAVVTPELREQGRTSMAWLKGLNLESLEMRFDPALLGGRGGGGGDRLFAASGSNVVTYAGGGTIDFGPIGAGDVATMTFTVQGAAVGMSVVPGWPILEAGLSPLSMYIGEANTVYVQILNASPATIDPAPHTFSAQVFAFGPAISSSSAGSGTFRPFTITGTVNGTTGSDGNATFSLSGIPSTLQLYSNGLLLTAGLQYTLAGSIITFLAPFIPVTGDRLGAFGAT